MVKETHTKGGYLFGLLTLPFISDKYLSNYEPVYRFILLVISLNSFFDVDIIFLLNLT